MRSWKKIACFLLMSFGPSLAADEEKFTVEGLATSVRNAHGSDLGFRGTIVTLVEARGLPQSASTRLLAPLRRAGYTNTDALAPDEAIVLIPGTELLNVRLGWCVRISGYTQPTIEDGRIKRAGTFQSIQHATRPRALYSRKGYSIVEHDQKIQQDIDLKHPRGDQLLSVPRLIELSGLFLKEGFGDDFELPFHGFALRSAHDLMGDPFWCAYVTYLIPKNLQDSIGSEILTVRLLPTGKILMRMVKDELATIPKFAEVEQGAEVKRKQRAP